MEIGKTTRVPTIWTIKNNSLCMYKEGVIVAMIPDHQFLKVMRDLIKHLDTKDS